MPCPLAGYENVRDCGLLILLDRPEVDDQLGMAAFFTDFGLEFAGLPGPCVPQLRRTPPRVVVKASLEGLLHFLSIQ